MRRIWIALIALAALVAAPAAARAQAPAGETATEAAAAAQSGAPVAAPASAPASSPLPASNPPRTLRAYTHVFAAFAIAWVLLFGYVVFIARKFRRVEEQLETLARA